MSDPLDGYRRIIEGARVFQEESREILAPVRRREPLLIGIGGKLAAGKDTLADHLVVAHGFVKHGMSEPLATALYTLNPLVSMEFENNRTWAEDAGIDLEQSSSTPGAPVIERYRELIDHIGYTQAKRIPEVRRLLQVLGTEVGRDQLDIDTWTNIARRKIREVRDAGVPVILTGIRFTNERDMILEEGGTLVWIERPEPNLLAFGSPEGAAPAENIGQAVVRAIDDALDPALAQYHTSEVTLTSSDFDTTILNDGSLKQLQQCTDVLIERLRDMKGQ